MRVTPRIVEKLVLLGYGKQFHRQQALYVPPGRYSFTIYPDREGVVWLMTSTKFSKVYEYPSITEIYSTPDAPISLSYEAPLAYRRFTIYAYRSFVETPLDVLLPISRTYPLRIEVYNGTSSVLYADSLTSYIEIDERIWNSLQEKWREELGI